MRYHFVVFVAALLVTSAAYAQNPPAQNQPVPASGPLILERIPNAWVLAPDFKVTDVDGRTGELAGAYGGTIIDNTLLIGGAALVIFGSKSPETPDVSAAIAPGAARVQYTRAF